MDLQNIDNADEVKKIIYITKMKTLMCDPRISDCSSKMVLLELQVKV